MRKTMQEKSLAVKGVTCLAAILLTALPLSADGLDVGGMTFSSWEEYVQSDAFKAYGGRCGTPTRSIREQLYGLQPELAPGDCSESNTDPKAEYDPGDAYTVNVVVHVIQDEGCNNGDVSDTLINSQIGVLNADFAAATNTAVTFKLASTDPSGNPTDGITRSCNTDWYNDGGNYWDSLAWDPNKYMNVYTNNVSGALGYVPFLPADGGGGMVGGKDDRVVINWQYFGKPGPTPPYDLGRTVTHEVGHFLGMEHTFNPEGSCGSDAAPGCYGDGDLICDTNTEQDPTYSPCAVGDKSTCGSVDPSNNYMDYSDDACMDRFTREQVRRIRCTLENYRCDLIGGDCEGGCEFNMRIPAQQVRAGEQLTYDLRLVHNRLETVTTETLMRITDSLGNIVIQRPMGEHTFVFGEESRIRGSIPIPVGQTPGVYTLWFGIGEMAQGSVIQSREFEVIE